jgi:hypothetical protein
LDVDVSARAPVAAIGRAVFDVFLSQETYAAMASRASVEGDGAGVREGLARIFWWSWVEVIVFVDVYLTDLRWKIAWYGGCSGSGVEALDVCW